MKKGFTLIELLVSILIIGILSAAALPQYERAAEKSRAAEALSLIASLRQAVDSYVAANGYISVELVGKMAGDTAANLDIDIEDVLDCTADDGDRCFSQYFSYDVYCSTTACYITAQREKRNRSYVFEAVKNSSTDDWTLTCDAESNDVGRRICKSFQGQGWNYSDD